MEWHINDLSICGQFRDAASLKTAIEPILRLRSTRPDLRSKIFCSRSLYLRPATQADTLQKALSSIPDKNFKELALRWFANAGPFWDDNRAPNVDDYFHLDETDVTDQGLGEAARRMLLEIAAGVFSFEGCDDSLCISPLVVMHGLPEEILHQLPVKNVMQVEELGAETFAPVASWQETLVAANATLTHLIFSEDILFHLTPYPFNSGIARRIAELLSILDQIALHTNVDGSLNKEGLELLQMHFVGEKASFTDESDRNKIDFKTEMTFEDPSNTGILLFCPWHGKVKIGQFRIHFEWPRPKNQSAIKILYVGPKITKR